MKIINRDGHNHYQFEETTALNIGNPQKVGQPSITYNREVIAGMVHPPLKDMPGVLSDDAIKRIESLVEATKSPVGAYTGNSKGWNHVRRQVAEYINRRDGVSDSDEDKVYLTNGASEGIRICFAALVRTPSDGILIPIPQYPLYSALLTLYGGELLPYYLSEEKGWGLNIEQIRA